MHVRIIDRTMVRPYLRYILPSMVALTLVGIYSIIDGIFVGNSVGDAGLAGVNVAFPLQSLVMSSAMGAGMGGAVISSIEAAQGHTERSQRAVGNTYILLAILAVPLMVLLIGFGRPLCSLLGGSGETLDQATTYITIMGFGVPFQVCSNGSMPLIRNRGGVNYAMGTQIISGALNVLFDWLFIMMLGWGIAGAALATVIAQFFSCCSCISFFLLRPANRFPRTSFLPERHMLAHMARLGVAPFGLTLVPDITVVIININANWVGGEAAVATYAVISYVAFIAQMLIQGVADGSQPLISTYYGRGDTGHVVRLRNTNYLVCFCIGALGFIVLTLLRHQVPQIFGASAATAAAVAHALPIYALSYLFYAFTHPSTSFFYAIDNARASTVLVLGEAALMALCVTGLGQLIGMDGIWSAVIVAQGLLALLSALVFRLVRHGHLQAASHEP